MNLSSAEFSLREVKYNSSIKYVLNMNEGQTIFSGKVRKMSLVCHQQFAQGV